MLAIFSLSASVSDTPMIGVVVVIIRLTPQMIMEQRIKEYVGKKAFLPVGEIKVMVKITDLKVSWGHERVLVAPISGEGQKWVGTEKLVMA